MPRLLSTRQLRFIVLFFCFVVLVGETTYQYRDQVFARQKKSTTTTALSEELELVTPLATPIATSKPVESYTITAFTEVRVLEQPEIDAAQKSFLRTVVPAPVSKITVYHLEYQIIGRDGHWKPVTAQVYIPASEGNYPIFVFGSGTTGIADKCAPSLENMAVENIGNYDNQMIAQTAAGFVSIFPDYEGFHDTSKTQAYFISESESKVLLGAIKSVLELRPTTPALMVTDTSKVFLAGYSQGGHAAFSAAQHWDELPTDVKLAGVIQYAGATDVQALFIESPWLASYLVASYTEYYGSDLQQSSVLTGNWLDELTKNNQSFCVNQAYGYYPHNPSDIYTQGFLEAVESDTWPEVLRGWKNAITQNTPLSDLPDVPYLLIQGQADPIVTATTQLKNVTKLCEQKKQVLYKEYQGVNHFQIRQTGFTFANDWIKNILADQPSASSCQ